MRILVQGQGLGILGWGAQNCTGYWFLSTFHFWGSLSLHTYSFPRVGELRGVVSRKEGQCLFSGTMALAPASGTSLPL